MEDEEMKEIYNPQNGERIRVRKPKWYANWRFWLLSAIAVMLFMISVSSVCTACAALNGNLASQSQEENASFVAREKKGIYYDADYVSYYGHNNNVVYNYTCTLDFWNGSNNVPLPYNTSHSIYQNSALMWGVQTYNVFEEVDADLYCDGVFVETLHITYSGGFANTGFADGHYYWFFDHDRYEEGVADGIYQGFVFKELGVIHDNRTFGFLPLTSRSPAADTTGTMYRVVQWPIFDYRVNDVVHHVWMMAEKWVYTTPNYWSVYAYDTTYGSYLPMEQAEAASFGSWVLPGGVELEDGSAMTYSWKVLSVDNGVITNILNGDAFRRYFDLGQDASPEVIYQQGYDVGYGAGYDGGYNVGVVDGANSVHPDSLTKTLTVVFQQPFNQIYRFFNFNVLGLNILALGCGLISVFIIIKIVKKVI